MTKALLAIPLLLGLVWLPSCAKKDAGVAADKPQATVFMRDGTSISGAVVASSASEISIQSADNVTHSIPMAQVRSVEYAGANPEPTASTPPAASPEPAPAGKPAAAPAAKPLPKPTAAAVTSRTHLVPAGTQIPVRTNDAIDSANAADGEGYSAQVTEDVKDAEGNVVIPRGADATIRIVSATQGGKIRGASDLVLDLSSVTVAGRSYALSTTNMEQKGREGVGANKRTALFTGGGAALGAVIGAIAGGGKGAAIGAASGAGAGALTQTLTKGKSIKVPSEAILTFQLDQAVSVEAR